MILKVKYLILVSLSGAIVALDQLTKMYIHTQFRVGESVTVIADYFNITSVRNPGAAFGFLAQSHPEFRNWFFLLIPPIALVVILSVMRTVPEKDKVQIFGLSMVFGGAIGNYIDRLRFRYVVDFLDFHIKDIYTWPAFNVADVSIVSGIGILLLLMVRDSRREKAAKQAKAQESNS
ncbi:MAG: signal peptidase II [Bdellovibrionales bacterium]|nr:signal peptidase II [Bdellovibrionales bacterium]